GVPPIDVYKVGDVYFVLDGNHRVSVARQLGITHIEANVIEFKTNVPLTPEDDIDDLIIKAELSEFLEQTRLNIIRPEANVEVTVPGRYRELQTHIEAHCFLMAQEKGMSREDAVADWYDNVYRPIVEVIREKGILRDFPGRTETDLYLWLHKHRADVQAWLNWPIDPITALADLVESQSSAPRRVLSRLEEKVIDAVTPDELESGPRPGTWRQEWLTARPPDRMFANILVPISGEPDNWQGLNQALRIAQYLEGQIYGLHVVASIEQAQSERTMMIRVQFEQFCRGANIPGQMAVEVGKVSRLIWERARWSDLVVMHLAHPPGTQTLAKLGSNTRTIIHRCPRPILLVPREIYELKLALVAYDASPKAREALFVAAHVAEKWQIPLIVLTVIATGIDKAILDDTQAYLEAQGVQGTYLAETGDVAETILQTAQDRAVDLIIMGGYGSKPVVEVILGSAVDRVLRESNVPILICR
ncbi:MAG: universal stress protein, partial [Anaerolineae bacterium]|nr:universal stress protein [Anaerolineae bacterium]